MNTQSLPSSFILAEPQRNAQKLSSPSYTNTTQTLSSSFPKMTHPSMPHNHTQSQSKHTSSSQKHQNSPYTIRMTLKSENYPLLTVDDIRWENNAEMFTSEMNLSVQYTVTKQLQENITWKLVYLGSAFS